MYKAMLTVAAAIWILIAIGALGCGVYGVFTGNFNPLVSLGVATFGVYVIGGLGGIVVCIVYVGNEFFKSIK